MSSAAPRNSSQLRGYQQRLITRIFETDATIANLPMGAGKTAITLHAADELISEGVIRRVLVVAPCNVAKTVWHAEAAQWTATQHMSFALLSGPRAARLAALECIDRAHVTVVNFENLQWLLAEMAGRDWPWDMLVVDELSRFKAHNGKTYKAFEKHLKRFTIRVGLTGTLTSTSLADTFNQVRCIDLGLRLGRSFDRFRTLHFTPEGYPPAVKWNPKPGATEAVMGALDDLIVRVAPEELPQLAGIHYRDVQVPLDPPARKTYEDMARDSIMLAGEEPITALNSAVLVGKLAQFASGFAYKPDGAVWPIHTAKREAVCELVEAADTPVLMFYHFLEDQRRLLEWIPEAELFDGSEAMVRRWNARQIPVMLVHPASAGHGLNLQHGGRHVVWYSATWSRELWDQANARIYRDGQAEPVFVHRLIVEDTVDEVQARVLDQRGDLAAAVRDLVALV